MLRLLDGSSKVSLSAQETTSLPGVCALSLGFALGMLLSGCAGAPPAGTAKDDCHHFSTNLREVWNDEAAARVGLGVAVARSGRREILTTMDQASEDWVRLSEQACRDYQSSGDRARYAQQRACFDGWLTQLRTLLSLAPQGLQTSAAQADALQRRVQSCFTASGEQSGERETAVREHLEGARLSLAQGRPEAALVDARAAREAAHGLGQLSLEAEAAVELGWAALATQRLETAKPNFDFARVSFESLGDDAHLASAVEGLGRVAELEGRWEEAIAWFRTLVRLDQRVFGPEASGVLVADRSKLTEALLAGGKLQEALQEASRCVAQARAQADTSRVLWAQVSTLHAEVLLALQAWPDAEQELESLAAWLKNEGVGEGELGQELQSDLAVVWSQTGRAAAASDVLARIVEQHAGVESAALGRDLARWGEALGILGQWAAAREKLRQAVEVFAHTVSTGHPWRHRAELLLAAAEGL